MVKDETTEQSILKSARETFKTRGFSGAKMAEIAKEAGINQALLHYYFRSKQNLFDTVFAEAVSVLIPKLITLLQSDLPLDVKIYRIVDYYYQTLSRNRDLPIFVLSEIRTNPGFMLKMLKEKGMDHSVLDKQIQLEIKKGKMTPASTPEFFSNVMGLILFPFIVEPLIKGLFQMSESDFQNFLEKRRRELPSQILKLFKSKS